jgi:hypothetical protein
LSELHGKFCIFGSTERQRERLRVGAIEGMGDGTSRNESRAIPEYFFCCNSAIAARFIDNQWVVSGSKVADVAANSDFNR